MRPNETGREERVVSETLDICDVIDQLAERNVRTPGHGRDRYALGYLGGLATTVEFHLRAGDIASALDAYDTARSALSSAQGDSK